MKIAFDNVNFNSTSGPNSFGRKLATAFHHRGHEITGTNPDVQLAFIQHSQKIAPMVQRLDGIYYNTASDWRSQNAPIYRTFRETDAVIYQSNFSQRLVEKFFGVHPQSFVIPNGTDLAKIAAIPKWTHSDIEKFDKVWLCASSWRPHKRLSENLRYFRENAGPNDCMLVAGANPDCALNERNEFYLGDLSWENLISVCKRASTFIHLGYLDNCPNVVIDARACGCQIIVSSSGGSRDVAGPGAIVILEDEWDMVPFLLYSPPRLDFNRRVENDIVIDIDINHVASEYENVLLKISGR